MNSGDMCNGAAPNPPPSSSTNGEPSSNDPYKPAPNGTSAVSPEMLYKLSKKIAQLTKVIYSLNTRNDDLSLDLENLRASYEEKIHQATEEIQKLHEERSAVNGSNSSESELISSNENLKKELHKTRNSLKNMEAKMAEREEENRQMIESLHNSNNNHGDSTVLRNGVCSSSSSSSSKNSNENNNKQLSEKVNQLMKENVELLRKLDRKDVLNENLKMEREALHQEVKDLNNSLSSMNLELSAARVELSYRRENSHAPDEATKNKEDNEFTDELIRRIEELTGDKSNMVCKLEEYNLIQIQQRSQIDDQKKVIGELECGIENEKRRVVELNDEILRLQNESVKNQDVDPAEITERVTLELQTQYETTLQDSKKFYEKELMDLQEMLTASENQVEEYKASHLVQTKKNEELEMEVVSLQNQMSQIRSESEAASKEIKESILEDCQKRIDEKEKSTEERVKEIQSKMNSRIEELETNLNEMMSKGDEVKCRILEIEGAFATKEKEYKDKIRGLEEALEQALSEREEILVAAGDEIQNEKNIAIEIEQRLMDDFEWKLREIEREHRAKLDEIKREAETQIRSANDAYNRSKDETFTKMSIDLHRDLEDKLKAERNTLKSSYEEQSHRDKETVYARAKVEFDREKRALETSFGEERTRLEREIRALKRRVDDIPNEVSRASLSLKNEAENKEREGALRLVQLQEQGQRELDELRANLTSELNRTKVDYQGRIGDLESRLRASDGHRLDSIFKVREDVEIEYAEKMEALRDMYLGEVEKESRKVEELNFKLSEAEAKNRDLTDHQGREIEELNSYIASREEEHESKINELLTRLQEQTTLAVRLQEEIDEYDWYIEDEEGNITERSPNDRPHSALRTNISRPPSTRPFESRARGSNLSLNILPASSRLDSSEEEKHEAVPPHITVASVIENENRTSNDLTRQPEFVEEEYLEESVEEEHEESTEPPSITNTKPDENNHPLTLSKASSASSVSYSSINSEPFNQHHKDLNENNPKTSTVPAKKHGKRSHCAQQ